MKAVLSHLMSLSRRSTWPCAMSYSPFRLHGNGGLPAAVLESPPSSLQQPVPSTWTQHRTLPHRYGKWQTARQLQSVNSAGHDSRCDRVSHVRQQGRQCVQNRLLLRGDGMPHDGAHGLEQRLVLDGTAMGPRAQRDEACYRGGTLSPHIARATSRVGRLHTIGVAPTPTNRYSPREAVVKAARRASTTAASLSFNAAALKDAFSDWRQAAAACKPVAGVGQPRKGHTGTQVSSP